VNPTDFRSAAPALEFQTLLDAARAVTTAYTAEAEDWNDGEFALWDKDDLVAAIVALRQVVGVSG
jgi:hypothetical protein